MFGYWGSLGLFGSHPDYGEEGGGESTSCPILKELIFQFFLSHTSQLTVIL